MMRACLISVSLLLPGSLCVAQNVATMPVTDAKLSGAVEVKGSTVDLQSGAAIQAGDAAVPVTLARGGTVQLCQNSALHISKGANAGELMLALDRGAVELRSDLGEFSDVLLTPDLRMLVSGPAKADVRVRINPQGDTCVENNGTEAPYVTITEQLGSSVYRLRAGQHVMFEHGSLTQVVDNEREPCGCPPATPALDANGKPAFPLAESEGLAKAAPPSTTPVVPPGETHAQVTIPFAYNGNNPPPEAVATPTPAAQPQPAATASPAPTQPQPQQSPDVFGAIKHFFHKLFGKKS